MNSFDKMTEIRSLLQPGILGFYNLIEVTEVYSVSSKGISNILTIMVAETHEDAFDSKEHILTENLIKSNKLKKWGVGIIKYHMTIDQMIAKLDILTKHMAWSEKQSPCSNLKLLDKYFVSPDSYTFVALNNIIKNNFHNGSYIFEWFDYEKTNNIDLLNSPQALIDISESINKILPISISSVSDRIGNYILQIPSSILMSHFGIIKQNSNYTLACEIAWHEKALPKDLIINCHLQENDNICEGYFTQILNSDQNKITFPIINKGVHIGTIWDPENNVILSRTGPSYIFPPNSVITTSISTLEQRVLDDGFQSKKIGIYVSDKNQQPQKIKPFKNWIEKRIYESDSAKLKNSREFVQYNPKGTNKETSKVNALDDLIYLINNHGQNAVWLWDPYLSYQDIYDTLLHNQHSNSVMRAISSLEVPYGQKQGGFGNSTNSHFTNIIDNYRDRFNNLPYETIKNINLEFRCKTGIYGWDFHDRFIIFPASDYKSSTQAWSLGTSINSFGKSHHILQKVQDAQLIANAFMDLWMALENDKCTVWRSSHVKI